MTRHRVTAALAALTVAAGALVAAAGPASAAARVTLSGGRPAADSATTVTVSGSGFQSVKGGFGGIYVVFGWVDDTSSWRPSRGGVTGKDYLYVPDSESKDNKGYQKFVAFPGSDTESAANGGEISASGSWRTTLTIPGARFEAVDRDGRSRAIDCTKVTCGVLTFGAHGVTNKNNETFTRVSFAAAAKPSSPRPTSSAAKPGASASTAPSPSTSAAAVAGTPATLGFEQRTVVVGRVLSFTGQGFLPGEQVVGTLGAGLAAVGPLTAGAHGEVAGIVQLPGDLRPGTQAFSLAGAASGQVAGAEFQAIADPVTAAAQANAVEPAQPTSPIAVGVGVLALALLGFLVSSFVAARRRRRGARA
ncbi:MAG: hypothetical protein AAGC49_03870 [Brevundimonas sp.]